MQELKTLPGNTLRGLQVEVMDLKSPEEDYKDSKSTYQKPRMKQNQINKIWKYAMEN